MIRIILLVSCLLISNHLLSQNDNHSSNFILVVDEKLCVGSIYDIHLIDENGKKVDLQYIPGELSIGNSVYKSLIKEDEEGLRLVFDYSYYEKGKQISYSYEIPFSMQWLDQKYLVLKIFNLDNKKNKKLFDPISKDKNYTFELEYPGGSTRRITK